MEKYKIISPPEKIQDSVAFANMYIGEGATMTSEPGVLVVRWIFMYVKRLFNLDDQEANYGLGYAVSNPKEALEIALGLPRRPNLKREWQKRQRSC